MRAFDLDSKGVARDILRANGVNLEDPGDEIGPVAPGSTSVGLWFHDPDGIVGNSTSKARTRDSPALRADDFPARRAR